MFRSERDGGREGGGGTRKRSRFGRSAALERFQRATAERITLSQLVSIYLITFLFSSSPTLSLSHHLQLSLFLFLSLYQTLSRSISLSQSHNQNFFLSFYFSLSFSLHILQNQIVVLRDVLATIKSIPQISAEHNRKYYKGQFSKKIFCSCFQYYS